MNRFITRLLLAVLAGVLLLIAALLPFSVYCAWSGIALDPGNSLSVFSELLADRDLFLVELAFAVLTMVARMVGLTNWQYSAAALAELSPLDIALCAFGILFLVAVVRIELYIYSAALRHLKLGRAGFMVRVISAAVSVTAVLSSCVLGQLIKRTGSVFVAVICCLALLLLIFGEKALVKGRFDGATFFETVNVFSELLIAVLKVGATTLFISFLAMAGDAVKEVSSPVSAILLPVLCLVGLYPSVYPLFDESMGKRVLHFFAALVLWCVCLALR